MKTFTVADIRSWHPCYDPSKKFNEVFTEEWSGTALDFLKLDHIHPQDRLWAVCREEIIDDKTLQLFAAWCARQALALVDQNPRSVTACDDAVRAAARAAAWEAARAAVGAAVGSAARTAARAAARAAVRATAAMNATWDAAAMNATWDAACINQVEHLIEMLDDQNTNKP